MRDFSEDNNSENDYLKKSIQQGKRLVTATKLRKLQSELKDIKSHTHRSIQVQTRKLNQFSWKKKIKQRGAGIKLSWGLARRNVTRSKYRTFLLVLGILLTVALETGIVISVDTLYDDFVFDHRNQNFTDITVHPVRWQNLTTMTRMTEKIARVSGVVKASPVFYARVSSLFGGTVRRSNILIYGIDSRTHPDFRQINITQGKLSLKDNRIIISESLFNQGGLVIGDSINLNDLRPEFKSQEVTLGGVMSDEPFFGNKIGFAFILLDLDLLYDIVDENQLFSILSSEIDIQINNLVNIKKISENIKDVVGIDYYVFSEKDISEIEASGIRAYQTAMNLVIMASFVVEFLFITNVLAISIRDRSKEFGILRAVGGKAYQLIESVALEILIYSAIGCTIGVMVGIAFSNVLVGIMDDYYVGVEFQQVSIHTTSIIVTYLSGVLVALISGLYPIFLAISMPIVQNIHSRMRSGSSFGGLTISWKYNIVTGALLALVGFILQYYVGPSRFLDFEILSIHFLAVMLIFIGTVLLEIGILVFLPKIAMKALIGFSFITRTISTRNIAREFQKSLFTIMTSALALAFIIVVGLISAAVVSGVPAYYENQWGAIDLVAETRDAEPLPTNATDRIDNILHVNKSSFIQEVRTEIGDVSSYAFGVDPAKYAYFSEPTIDSISTMDPYIMLNQSNVNQTFGVISHLLYQRLHEPLGSNITLKIADNSTVNITLAAVIKANVFLGNGEYLYIPTAHFREFFNTTMAKWFLCDVNDERFSSVKRSLELMYPEFKEDGIIPITFFSEMMKKSLIFQSAIFQVLFIESFILAAIAQFVCILVSTLRMEREIGIMRSLGLNRRGVFGIFMTESIALGASALIVGLLDGVIGAILLADYISESIPINVSFPVTDIIIWMSFSFLITIFSTILPSFRSSRKNIVATISGRPMVKGYKEKDPYRSSTDYRAVYSQKPGLSSSSNPINQNSHFISPFLTGRTTTSYEQRKLLEGISKSGIFRFIRNNTLPLQTVFLLLMAIITFNYIMDVSIVIRGLNTFDTAVRGFIQFSEILGPQQPSSFMIFNPLLAIVGMALITPIVYYLTHKEAPESFIYSILSSLFWACVGICTLAFSLLTAVLTLIVLFIPVHERNQDFWYPGADFPLNLFMFISFLLVGVFILYLFQKFWYFMIIRGIESELSFQEHFYLLKSYGSGGAFGFILLILGHILFQTVLYSIFGPFPISDWIYRDYSASVPLEPTEFLIYSIYEVGIYLLLIIYPIVYFSKTVNEATMRGFHSEPREVKTIPIEMIIRSQNLAKNILHNHVRGISINHDGIHVFSEVIDGHKLLFFQEESSSVPVAMNYSLKFPKEYVPLSTNHLTEIKIPNADQIELFIKIVSELKFTEKLEG